uniref:CubicO group peptidase, beta-lactamase class C family n=1 Tax=Candidatus Kentrum sp. DK TaxID=2126562 RepID=A0A450TB88_9GAMM|nr:MAG: CubicO group peptidase, beta-lactamase class C family [Candidatus Kentron sp. DK]
MKSARFPERRLLVLVGLLFFAAANTALADVREKDLSWQHHIEEAIDTIVAAYQQKNGLPAISVAVVRNGQMFYRKGFGWADVEEKKPAHARTVYSIGSVSKPIAAALAVKLEEEGHLQDGTPVSLDLSRPTSAYLTDIPAAGGLGKATLPAFHVHTVDQLLSHTGCVADFPDRTTPGIANRTTHYSTAIEAVQSIWDTGLVTKMSNAGFDGKPNDGPCVVGKNWSYSTPAFTFVAAVLESATGRPIAKLLREELFVPYGLTGTRMKYAAPMLVTDENRATPYDKDNHRTTYENDSWRALGGGLESNAMDLARFGSMVLNAEIISARARDNRLWRQVAVTNPSPGYALGWGITTDAHSRRIAEHPGMATGGRALLRIYRDEGLVIAIVSNRREHPVNDVPVLAERIGEKILGMCAEEDCSIKWREAVL